MRRLQQLSTAVALTLMLTTGAFAGIIETPVRPPEPPSTTALGIIQTPSSEQNSSTPSEALGEATLNLLQSLLSVF